VLQQVLFRLFTFTVSKYTIKTIFEAR